MANQPLSQTAVTNVIIAGLGGQGVLKASDILSDAVFRAGRDVKKSEIHGMAQRGGSVSSDVRFGGEVFSPMVPAGEADYLVVLDATQAEPNRHMLREGGVMITPSAVDANALANRKSLNVALLGVLSAYLDIPEFAWTESLHANLNPKIHAVNDEAFAFGRKTMR
jgi:indolepyruvate ferredoxin oxidoreductase beta subunit